MKQQPLAHRHQPLMLLEDAQELARSRPAGVWSFRPTRPCSAERTPAAGNSDSIASMMGGVAILKGRPMFGPRQDADCVPPADRRLFNSRTRPSSTGLCQGHASRQAAPKSCPGFPGHGGDTRQAGPGAGRRPRRPWCDADKAPCPGRAPSALCTRPDTISSSLGVESLRAAGQVGLGDGDRRGRADGVFHEAGVVADRRGLRRPGLPATPGRLRLSRRSIGLEDRAAADRCGPAKNCGG